MYLIINGYEFGQWLRILLWIGLPATMILTMLKTWIRYRRGRIAEDVLLQMEGLDEGGAFSFEPIDQSEDESEHLKGDGRVEMEETERSVKDGDEDYKENLYKGILWMKEKYEQYRDLADERYDRLKDQLTRMEKKYEDLLAQVQSGDVEIRTEIVREVVVERAEPTEPVTARAEAGGDRIRIQELEAQLARTQQRFDEEVGRLRHQLEDEIGRGRRLQDERNAGFDANRLLEQQLLYSNRALEEKQRMMADMEGQQTTDRIKIEELVAKLRNNSQLLMNIYQELDKSLHFSDTPRE